MFRCNDCYQTFDSPKNLSKHGNCLEISLTQVDNLPNFTFKVRSTEIEHEIWNTIFMSFENYPLAKKRLRYLLDNSSIADLMNFFFFFSLHSNISIKARTFLIEQLDYYYNDIIILLEKKIYYNNNKKCEHIIKIFDKQNFQQLKASNLL